MSQDNVAPVSEEVQPAAVEEVEETEEPSESEASDQEDEAGGEEEESEEDDAEEEGEETAEDAEESEEDTPAQKRIQELANKRREAENRAKAAEERTAALERKFAEMEAKLKEQADARPTVDTVALNNHLGQMREQIDFLRLEGRNLDADIMEQERLDLIREYKQWDQENRQREQATKATQETQAQVVKRLQEFDRAAVMLKDHYKLPDEVFSEMGNRFRELVQTDPVFQGEFKDMLDLHGPTKAAVFVHERLEADAKARKAAAEVEKKRRNEAKEVQVKPSAPGKPFAKGLDDQLPIDIWIQRRNAQLKKK